MRSNYPDYNKISIIAAELEEVVRKLDNAQYWDEEAHFKEKLLEESLEKLLVGEPVKAEGMYCKVQYCGHPVYYPSKIHHLDGDINNESFGNLALVCPKCEAHILLSRFSPEDIWILKTRGLSNAEIGRLLGLSRERVRQLCKKYEAKQQAELAALMDTNIEDLVKKAEYIENHLIASGRLNRRIDRRTKRKRLIAELNRLKQEANI